MSYIATIEAEVNVGEKIEKKTYYINAKNKVHALKLVKHKINVDFANNSGYNTQVIE